MAAAELPRSNAGGRSSSASRRRRAAHRLRSFTVQLLQIIGLLLAGGILLLWVAWKLWREIAPASTVSRGERGGAREAALDGLEADPAMPMTAPRKSFRQAVTQIVIADVSMSLDNVLAVAGRRASTRSC